MLRLSQTIPRVLPAALQQGVENVNSDFVACRRQSRSEASTSRSGNRPKSFEGNLVVWDRSGLFLEAPFYL
jgi:hypothetical protein